MIPRTLIFVLIEKVYERKIFFHKRSNKKVKQAKEELNKSGKIEIKSNKTPKQIKTQTKILYLHRKHIQSSIQ